MKRNLLIIIIIIIGLVILVAVGQLMGYNKLKNEARKACGRTITLNLDHRTDLIGLLDSYGVPFSPKVKKTFLDYLYEEVKKGPNDSSKLDLYNLYINKTWNLEGELRNDITIGEHVLMQNYSIDFIRHKYGPMIRDDLHYSCDDNETGLTIYEYISACENPTILYSCAANDLFFYFNATPEYLSLHKVIDIIKHADEGIQLMGDSVAQNIDTLLACNPTAQIYVMGLYVPSDHFLIQRFGTPFINKINQELKNICEANEQVYYVDVSCLSFTVLEGDFHPDQNGQKILAVKLAESMNLHENERVGGFEVDKTGSQESIDTIPANNNESVQNDLIQDNPAKNGQVQTDLVQKIYTLVENSDLPQGDYVECSVAIEQALSDLGLEDISEEEILRIRPEYVSLWADNPQQQQNMDKAMEVLYIERKILRGYNIKEHALFPEDVKNDKLSLID